MSSRPNWKEYFSEIVQVTSKRSACSRLKVGCLLVKENRIISQGYNGFLPEAPHESIIENNHEQATVHAEQNAIADCAKRGASCDGCTAYITHYPCIICTRLLLAGGIKKIKYVNDYKNDDLVKEVKSITNKIRDMAGAASKLGKGGMVSKIKAAEICMKSKCSVIITSGLKDNPIKSLSNKKTKSTKFIA